MARSGFVSPYSLPVRVPAVNRAEHSTYQHVMPDSLQDRAAAEHAGPDQGTHTTCTRRWGGQFGSVTERDLSRENRLGTPTRFDPCAEQCRLGSPFRHDLAGLQQHQSRGPRPRALPRLGRQVCVRLVVVIRGIEAPDGFRLALGYGLAPLLQIGKQRV